MLVPLIKKHLKEKPKQTPRVINVQGMVCKDITCRKGLESTESKTTKNGRIKAQHDATRKC